MTTANRINYSFIWSDYDYNSAINYEHDYYNAPITFNVGQDKYILPFGTHDSKQVRQDGHIFYIVGENRGLDYISLVVIDTQEKTIQSVYLSGDDVNHPESYSYGIIGMDVEAQIRIMCEWL
jgi:hypothetical protein